jgi:flagellar biosynthesis anti-sigma factor FlgM
MKISDTEYAKVLQIERGLPESPSPENAAAIGDDISLLDFDKDPELVKEIAKRIDEMPEARAELVEELRARIAAGKYKVSSEAVAELMLRRAKADKIR